MLDFKKHLDADHKTIHEKIKCHFCPEKFAKGADINAHLESVHAIKCQFCPAKFMKNKDLDQHFNTSHKKSRVEIKCHLFHALFGAVLDLKKHLDTEHKKKCEKKNCLKMWYWKKPDYSISELTV